jgi:hypothetical protein
LSRPPEFAGQFYSIISLELADGSCPAGDFLDDLPESDRRKMDLLFEKLGCSGRINNKEKFKKLEDSDHIWAFKSFQIRMPCFFAPGKLVLLEFGLFKKRDKYSPQEVQRAEQYRKWYFDRHHGRN